MLYKNHMKKYVLFVVALLAIQNIVAQNGFFKIKNSTRDTRNQELIVLSRKQIEKKMGKLNKGHFVNVTSNNKPIVVQFDDLNTDGVWDELCFQKTLGPKEKVIIELSLENTKPKAHTVNTRARHRRKNIDNSFGEDLKKDSIPAGQKGADFSKVKLPPFLTEGPAWENDKVGFRIYFDIRNAKDIWGKITSDLVLDKVGIDPNDNYHEKSAWGMDILKVGTSLGAGGLAIKFDHQKKDTIVRLGGEGMGGVVYEKIADGPVRSIIRLQYPSWTIGRDYPPVSLVEEISIWGGQYYYQSQITINHAPKGASLIVGLVNLKSKELNQRKDKGARYIYTFSRQSENNDNLGLAILLPKGECYFVGTTANANTDVQNTHYVAFPIKSNETKAFRFLAGWEKSSIEFAQEQGFKDYVSDVSFQYLKPLNVK